MKKQIMYLMALICCLCGFFISSCQKETFNSESIAENCIKCVVEIKVIDDNDEVVGYATGTIISSDGKILTNRHVVREYDFETQSFIVHNNIFVRYYDEENYYKAEIINISLHSDLALIKCEISKQHYFKVENHSVHNGSTIYTIGNGSGFGLTFSKGVVGASRRNVKYESEIISTIQLSMMINEGNSGGPLINEKGQLIGLITFRLRDNNGDIIYGTCFALPLETILEFLENKN